MIATRGMWILVKATLNVKNPTNISDVTWGSMSRDEKGRCAMIGTTLTILALAYFINRCTNTPEATCKL